MPEPLWIVHIRHEGRIRASFEEWIGAHRKKHVEEMENCLRARDLEGAAAALAKQETLDALLREISSYDREEKQRVALDEKINGK